MAGVDNLVGADGGEVAVTLIGKDAGLRVDTLDAGGDSRGAAVRGLKHVAVEVVVSEHGASDGGNADDVVLEAELFYAFSDQAMRYTVIAAGAVVEHGIGEHLGLFKYYGHYNTSLMLSSLALISSGVGIWLP